MSQLPSLPPSQNVSILCVCVGLVFSLVFHLGVREPAFVQPSVGAAGDSEDPGTVAAMRKRDWFRERTFYQIAVLYMATRLYCNLYQVVK